MFMRPTLRKAGVGGRHHRRNTCAAVPAPASGAARRGRFVKIPQLFAARWEMTPCIRVAAGYSLAAMKHPRPAVGAAALIGLGALVVAAPASAQTLSYQLTPAYVPGPAGNGDNGWYRVPVTVTYTCTAPPGYVVVECPVEKPPGPATPGQETFDNRGGGPFVRTATFAPADPALPAIPSARTTLEAAPAVALRGSDTLPPLIWIERPRNVTAYDAGVPVTVRYAAQSGHGPSPQTATGPVPSGGLLDVGVAGDPATWGPRTFTVTAADAAGNTSALTHQYTVDDFPGKPALQSPGDAVSVPKRPVLTWLLTDLGVVPTRLRVEVQPKGQKSRTYDGVTSPFTLPEDLPAGEATWRVTAIDSRAPAAGHTVSSDWRRINVVIGALPAAPGSIALTSAAGSARPSFIWSGEADAAFDWVIVQGDRAVLGPASVPVAALQSPATLAPGAYALRVRQTTPFGGTGPWSGDFAFTVAPGGSTAGTTVPTPAVAAVQGASGLPKPRAARYPTVRAKRLTPRAGVRTTRRPLLRWARVKGASLYNVQVFRVVGTRYVKVVTAFPRTNRYRVPRNKLRRNAVHVWRVWPYMRTAKRYKTAPVGVSWFRPR